MRNLQLVSPLYTNYGTVTLIKLLDSKFESRNKVSIKVQAFDAQGNKIGVEKDFRDTASDRTDLRGSANSLAMSNFGQAVEVLTDTDGDNDGSH